MVIKQAFLTTKSLSEKLWLLRAVVVHSPATGKNGRPLIMKVPVTHTHQKTNKQTKQFLKEDKKSVVFISQLFNRWIKWSKRVLNEGVSLMAKHLSLIKMDWNALFRAPKVHFFPRKVPSLFHWKGFSPLHTYHPHANTFRANPIVAYLTFFLFLFKFSWEPWKTAKRLSCRVLDPIGKVAVQRVH